MLSGSAEIIDVCCMVVHTCTCENKRHMYAEITREY